MNIGEEVDKKFGRDKTLDRRNSFGEKRGWEDGRGNGREEGYNGREKEEVGHRVSSRFVETRSPHPILGDS